MSPRHWCCYLFLISLLAVADIWQAALATWGREGQGKRTGRGRGKEGIGLECSGADTGPLNFLFPLASFFAIGLRY